MMLSDRLWRTLACLVRLDMAAGIVLAVGLLLWLQWNDMTKLIVDGKEIDVPPAYTLLQACEAAGAEIPRFCFHERLSIAGNCRMCLVELKGSPKPVASCAWGVRDCRPGPNGEPPEVEHQDADGAQGARRRDGVPADQSPARLPDLRPGRGMRPAGPGDGLRRRFQPLRGEQARGRGQVRRAAGQDHHESLHSLHAVRSIHDRSRRRAGARGHRPRRGHGDHDLPRAGDDLRIAGQRGRSLSGRRADLQALRLCRAAVGTGQDRVRSTSWTPSARPSASTRAAARSCASFRASTTM